MSCCCLISIVFISFICILINIFRFLIIRFMFVFFFFVLYVLLSILCVLCFCIILCIVSLHAYSYFLLVYNFTDNCHRVETQFEVTNIVRYHIVSASGRAQRYTLCTSATFWTKSAVDSNLCQTTRCRVDNCLGKHCLHSAI